MHHFLLVLRYPRADFMHVFHVLRRENELSWRNERPFRAVHVWDVRGVDNCLLGRSVRVVLQSFPFYLGIVDWRWLGLVPVFECHKSWHHHFFESSFSLDFYVIVLVVLLLKIRDQMTHVRVILSKNVLWDGFLLLNFTFFNLRAYYWLLHIDFFLHCFLTLIRSN